MTYTWSEEQRRGLTFGSTVEGRAVCDALDIGRVRFEGDAEYRYLNLHDPSTLRPPTIEWIRELARERLGEDAYVHDIPKSLGIRAHVIVIGGPIFLQVSDTPSMDRFRAAVAAIVAIGNAWIWRHK